MARSPRRLHKHSQNNAIRISSTPPIELTTTATTNPNRSLRTSRKNYKVIDLESKLLSISSDEEQSVKANGNEAEGKDEDKEEDVQDSDDLSNVYDVERIVNHRTKDNRLEYFVKWKGWSSKDNTWEPDNNIAPTCSELIDDYWNAKEKKGTSTSNKRARDATTEDVHRIKQSTMTSTIPPKSSNKPARDVKAKEVDDEEDEEDVDKVKQKAKKIRKDSPNQVASKILNNDLMWPPSYLKCWEADADKILKISRDPKHGLVVTILWKKNKMETRHPKLEVYEKCPRKMLEFYEDHLQWRTQD